MKSKKNLFFTLIVMLFSTSSPAAQPAAGGKKALVAYFSYSGNTREVARLIAEATGADLFEIEPNAPYPSDYQSVVDQAKREIEAGNKPVLKTNVKNLDAYDVVFVGSPCWWATIAPPVATFLSENDLSGKTVAPFMTHEGSRMGHSLTDIRKLCPKSTVTEGLPVRGSHAGKAGEEIGKWLRNVIPMR